MAGDGMIVSLFTDEPYKPSADLQQAREAVAGFCSTLRQRYTGGSVEARWIRLDLWASGLNTAMAELDESAWLASRFAAGLAYRHEEDMPEEDRRNYYRHLYFYKDSIVRLFSVLDKTGYFLDTMFDLNTGKVKAKFSYFTVLRELRRRDVHPELERRLVQIKQEHRDPMDRLRRKRNLEIHAMNVELIDDVWQKRQRFADRRLIEPLQENLRDLEQGLRMAGRSLLTIFRYCAKTLR
jgi:hypothetical protein